MNDKDLRPDGWQEIHWHHSEMPELMKLPRNSYAMASLGSDLCSTQFDDAVKMLTIGYPDKLQLLEEHASIMPVTGLIVDDSLTSVEATSGAVVNVEKYLSGEPECMVDFQIQKQPGKIVRLVVNRAAGGDTSEEAIEKRGAMVMIIQRALELKGYSVGVEVIFCNSSRGSVKGIEHWIEIKRPSEIIDPSILAFWLMHAASHRRIGWRLREIFAPSVADSSYGRPEELIRHEGLENCIIFPFVNQRLDHETMKGLCVQCCAQVGIDIFS